MQKIKNLLKGLWSSRNFKIDTIVIHYMSGILLENCKNPYSLETLIKIFKEYGVSSHYLILRNGEVHSLVPEKYKAWHSGKSIMPAPDNREGVNDFSIGIELAGGEDIEFTDEQYTSLNSLIIKIKSRYSISNILGHSDISGKRAVKLGVREDIKKDPGVKFNWDLLQNLF